MYPEPMHRLTSRISKYFIIIAFIAAMTLPLVVSAQTTGTDAFQVTSGSFDILRAPDLDLRGAIIRVVQYLLGFLAVVVVLVILYGGFVWMTAGGDDKKIIQAKKIIRNGIIGLVIILVSFGIVTLIFNLLGYGRNNGGPDNPCPGCASDRWRSGIGLGPIASTYPEKGQQEVPINTWIAVTFKEQIVPNSICDDRNGNDKCDGEPLKHVQLCLYTDTETARGCVTDDVPDNFSADEFTATTVSQTNDNRTFVLTPNKYLGQQDQVDRQFYVVLQKDILAKATNASVFNAWGGSQYAWDFTTNGEVDLDPPEILSTNELLNPRSMASVSGVFPDPDNEADLYALGTPASARRLAITITDGNNQQLKSQQVATVSAVIAQTPNAPAATINGTYGGRVGGNVTIVMGNDLKPKTTYSDGSSFTDTAYNGGTVFSLGNGLQMSVAARPEPGTSWSLTVTPAQTGDQLELTRGVNNLKRYVIGADIQTGSTGAATAAAIANRLVTDFGSLFKLCGTGCVETVETGTPASEYDLKFVPAATGTANLIMVTAAGGVAASEQKTVTGRPDVARNAIIQITFNEAVSPLIVDQGVFQVRANIDGDTNLSTTQDVSYTAEISNNYRTIELRSTEACGQNACGEQITCWPTNALVKANPQDYAHKATYYSVGIGAAPLRTCGADTSWCSAWRGQCTVGDVCTKTIGSRTIKYPGTATDQVAQGVIDIAGNSLNGSFDYYTDADAPNTILGASDGASGTGSGHSGKNFYILNAITPLYTPSMPATGGIGDSFNWSFWISDKIELRSPLVSRITPIGDEVVVDYRQPVVIEFNGLVRSSTLKPGWNYGETILERSQRYVAFETLTKSANPVGYWIAQDGVDRDRDSFADVTTAEIRHSRLDPNISYTPFIGSGVQDVYQNCFLPGAGPKNAGNGAGNNNCQYQSATDGTTVGCTSDVNGSGQTQSGGTTAQVTLPNPASYAKMRCEDISGAATCATTCFAHHSTAETPIDGSWVVTEDYPNGLGCCFGKCTP
jgi:hypothetical protein